VLGRDQVIALAEEEGLDAWALELVDTVVAGWRLEPRDPVSAPDLTADKIGGQSTFAAGTSWPRNDRGIAMTLLAQINCATLRWPAAPWSEAVRWTPPQGMLQVFADLLDSPWSACRARILQTPVDAALCEIAPPPVPDPWPAGGPDDIAQKEERFDILPEIVVELQPCLTAPERHATLRPFIWSDDPPGDAYERWRRRLMSAGASAAPGLAHLLLGHPTSIQDNVLDVPAANLDLIHVSPGERLDRAEEWTVLLTVHSDMERGLDLGGGGAAYVLVPTTDLGRGSYERLICTVQPD
jgi:hypothetical protein